MPIKTDLNAAPYHDDYREDKDFHKILFRPGVSVQVRELNQLQTILQKQIELFGDHVFKRGTIVNGCNFEFFSNLPYVKLRDLDVDLKILNVSSFKNYFVRNNANLVARVVETFSGFESTDPNLNTLYISYLNAGNTGSIEEFSAGETLTVYDGNNSIFSGKVDNGSLNFSNNDSVVFLSAIEIQNTTGGTTLSTPFSVNEIITQATTGAQANVIAIDLTSNTQSIVLKLKPLSNNMANGVNSLAWNFQPGYTITGATSGASANISGVIGNSASATVVTDGAGVVTNVHMVALGQNYYVEPYISIASSNNTGNTTAINNLSITARNYINKITVAPATFSNPVNTAYAFAVSEGVIYQKGYFSRVDSQLVIVDRYSNTPHQKVIGFDTVEEIINSNSDSSLLDNILGSGTNQNAPGANRLKLTPVLTVLDKESATANDEFFNIVEFSEGKPFKQARTTEYNELENALAKRTYDESGNFVLNPFRVETSYASTFADEANNFHVVIDPGLAYIQGYEVQTYFNQAITTPKAKTTAYISDNSVDIDYGNYIEINQLGGYFGFNTGSIVSLRSAANTYLSSYAGATISSGPGSEIGSARVKSIVFIDGEATSSRYKMYLFDIRMVSGKNFRDVKSVFYDGTNKGVADVILTLDGTTNTSIASLKSANQSRLLFPTKTKATKTLITNNSIGINQGNVVFTYKTVANNLVANTSGNVVISVSSPEFFPYAGTLSDNEKEEIVIIPLANAEAGSNSSGSVAVTTAQSNVIGTATAFNTTYNSGDFIKVANSTALEVRMITKVTNATHMTVSSAFTNSFSGANTIIFYPKNVPLAFASRSNRSGVVTGNTTLTLSLGHTLNVDTTMAVSYNVKRRALANTNTKIAKRKLYVKIRANTHVDTVNGPWCLGVPDIFRLRNVYVAEDTNVNVNSTSVTNEFYIDHNQTEDYHGLGYLYKKPTSSYVVTANAVLLAEFDAFTTSAPGLITIDSYPVDDTISLSDADLNPSNSSINTIEIPEMNGYQGSYYDARDILDFRPISANTAALANTTAGATVNPVEPSDANRFNTTTEKYFPVPQSDVFFDIEYYLPRIDRVVVDSVGNFRVIQGPAGEYTTPPSAPQDTITLDVLKVPAYPSYPTVFSPEQLIYNDRKIANETYLDKRLKDYAIKTITLGMTNIQKYEQPRRYTQADIGSLDRRIADLEYQSTLSHIEDNIKDQTITSSNDPAINRFKFGFFVDNFTTTNFSNFDSPEYNATIFEDELAPRKDQLNLLYRFYTEDANTNQIVSGDVLSLPYEEFTLVQQLNATVPIPSPNTTPTQNNCSLYSSSKDLRVWSLISNYSTSVDDSLLVSEITEIKDVANTAHTISLFFDCHSGTDRFEIYQTTGNTGSVVAIGGKTILVTTSTPIATSEQSVVLSATDRTNLTSNGVLNTSTTNNNQKTGPWTTSNRPDFSFTTRGINTKYWVKNAGKISWTHNPALGSIYKIVVIKGSPVHGYYLKYDSEYILCGNTVPAPVVPKPQEFNGSPFSCVPTYAKATTYIQEKYVVPAVRKSIVNGKIAEIGGTLTLSAVPIYTQFMEQAFEINVVGLQPNTNHKFFANETNETSNCAQEGLARGAGLKTDATGRCKFTYYMRNKRFNYTDFTDKYSASHDVAEATAHLYCSFTTGNESITINNSAGTKSWTSFTITMNSYYELTKADGTVVKGRGPSTVLV